MRLVEELGFDQVNAGGLDDSWPQLPGTPVPAADLILESGCSTVADAGGKRRREFQATDESPGTYAKPAYDSIA
jgi:hypothetical protein